MSGQLPNDGCDHVEVVSRDGSLETRSMIYTEYFVKGTQPSTVCPIHKDASFLDALAGVFGKDSGPPPVPAEAAGGPSAPVSTTGAPASSAPAPAPAPPAAAAEQQEEPKKRGFWSRVFGLGKKKDDRKEDDKKNEDERKKPGVK
jgi:penicillin-binding protein 1B